MLRSSPISFSTREKSRISLIMARRASPPFLMPSMNSFCSAVMDSSRRRPENPITAFMGVLSSWDMLARNAALVLVVASAFSLANTSSAVLSIISSSIRLRSVMSMTAILKPWLIPSWIARASISTQSSAFSFLAVPLSRNIAVCLASDSITRRQKSLNSGRLLWSRWDWNRLFTRQDRSTPRREAPARFASRICPDDSRVK